MQIVEKWSIGVQKEFRHNYMVPGKIVFILYRDEDEKIVEMDITELRKLKTFFENFKDPFETGNPQHVGNMK